MSFKTWKDRMLSRIFSRYPFLVEGWARSEKFVDNLDTPWVPFAKELEKCKISLVTTAGVHLRSQAPFDMKDRDGDATWREIASWVNPRDLTITHNYYDHRDADRDINIVFPLERLRELATEGIIGGIAPRHFSFMGHIIGRHLGALIRNTGPEVGRMLKQDNADAVLLTPA